jgi:RNA polymerase sigma-70 factor, ECF subfamily
MSRFASPTVSKQPYSRRSSMSVSKQLNYQQFFEDALAEHHSAIGRVVSSYERVRALQEELYQEISVALWKALANFDHRSSLKTYILGIAHKRAISHVAKYAREPYTSDIETMEIKGNACPSEQLAQSQRMNRLLASLHQLSMMDRQLVALALEGVKYKDIAEILGITTNLVGVKLNRAKHKLKELMTLAN